MADPSTRRSPPDQETSEARELYRDQPISIKGGKSFVGTDRPEIEADGEGPARSVYLRDFALEPTTVTNARFAKFVAATNYVTEAELVGWSVVFSGDKRYVPGASISPQIPWWHKIKGVSWWRPEGPESSIEDRMDHPVVQVSWNDACAFANWAGGRLPTEVEWEHAARGGSSMKRFPWGDKEPSDHNIFCNIWQGRFPDLNTLKDGYARTAPAKSFEPNAVGLYSLCGNVWEWTHDAYRIKSLSRSAKLRNAGALSRSEKVLKGGSFLCHISHCYRYRIASRIAMSRDSAGPNVGFRIAYDVAETVV